MDVGQGSLVPCSLSRPLRSCVARLEKRALAGFEDQAHSDATFSVDFLNPRETNKRRRQPLLDRMNCAGASVGAKELQKMFETCSVRRGGNVLVACVSNANPMKFRASTSSAVSLGLRLTRNPKSGEEFGPK